MIDVTLRDVLDARRRIAGVARPTPLEHSVWLTGIAGHDVYLKLECWQRTRSFKMRGACNAIASLSAAERARGLVTASAGNHGQALALAAREVGARATIFLPRNAPETKKNRIRAFGAALRDDEATYDDAEVAALEFARKHGATFVHAFSDPAVVAGQGTVGLEIAEALPQLRHAIVPVGGGGLIIGVGMVLKSVHRDVEVIGVQSTRTTAMYDAFEAGQLTDCPIPPTLADGLAGCTDQISYERAKQVVDSMRLVEEDGLPVAIAELYRHEGVVAEGAAATAVAAILQGVTKLSGPAVLVITGGNIDAKRFAGILADN